MGAEPSVGGPVSTPQPSTSRNILSFNTLKLGLSYRSHLEIGTFLTESIINYKIPIAPKCKYTVQVAVSCYATEEETNNPLNKNSSKVKKRWKFFKPELQCFAYNPTGAGGCAPLPPKRHRTVYCIWRGLTLISAARERDYLVAPPMKKIIPVLYYYKLQQCCASPQVYFCCNATQT